MKPSKGLRSWAAVLGFCAVGWGADGELTIYMGGKPMATESYSLQKKDGKFELSGTGKAEMGPMKISIDRFDVLTDADFHPLSVQAKAQMGQMKIEDTVTFVGGKAKNQLDRGQGPETKEDDVHADTLVVNANLPLFAWTLLTTRVKLDNADPQPFHAYIVGQEEVPVTVVFRGKETVEFDQKKAELNRLAMTFSPGASAQVVQVDFWVDDARRIIKVSAPSHNVEAYQQGFAPLASPAVSKPLP